MNIGSFVSEQITAGYCMSIFRWQIQQMERTINGMVSFWDLQLMSSSFCVLVKLGCLVSDNRISFATEFKHGNRYAENQIRKINAASLIAKISSLAFHRSPNILYFPIAPYIIPSWDKYFLRFRISFCGCNNHLEQRSPSVAAWISNLRKTTSSLIADVMDIWILYYVLAYSYNL